ncbi:MAG: hypothetical protein QOG22_3304 [Pseudonocardiales bacterium]|jgi:hypothetical protein|nr:hypothetical protein [Pseudonocardiales bacterium]
MAESTSTMAPKALRRLDSPEAKALVDLVATFEELQTVLRCCERLVTALAAGDSVPDDVVVEAVWTMALLSYARCFTAGEGGTALTEDDITAAKAHGDALEWHRVLLQLRAHYADPVVNPRERYSVGVAQDPSGAPSGVAITSGRQPLVDDLTVRQTGAIAYALSALVDERIAAQQEKVFAEVKDTPKSILDKLSQIEVVETE